MTKVHRKFGTSKKTITPHQKGYVIHAEKSECQLNDEYKDVLEFAVKLHKRKSRCNDYRLSYVAEQSVKQAFFLVVFAGQTGQMQPKKLKRIVAASAKNSNKHGEWKAQTDLEQQHSIMAGVSRFVKIS